MGTGDNLKLRRCKAVIDAKVGLCADCFATLPAAELHPCGTEPFPRAYNTSIDLTRSYGGLSANALELELTCYQKTQVPHLLSDRVGHRTTAQEWRRIKRPLNCRNMIRSPTAAAACATRTCPRVTSMES